MDPVTLLALIEIAKELGLVGGRPVRGEAETTEDEEEETDEDDEDEGEEEDEDEDEGQAAAPTPPIHFPPRCPECDAPGAYLPNIDGFKCASCGTVVVRRPDEAEDVFESQKARYRRAIDKLQHENVGYTGGSYYGPALSVGVIGAVVGFFLGVKDVGVGWFWNAVIGYAAITVPALMLAVRADGQHYAAYHAALEANAQKHAPTIHRLEQKLTLLQNTYYG